VITEEEVDQLDRAYTRKSPLRGEGSSTLVNNHQNNNTQSGQSIPLEEARSKVPTVPRPSSSTLPTSPTPSLPALLNNSEPSNPKLFKVPPEVIIEPEEEILTEAEERLLLMARFKILKKRLNDINIQIDPNDYEAPSLSLKQLRKIYNIYKTRLFAEGCTGKYRKILIAGFVIIEVLAVRFLGIDMTGFTVNQLMAMNTYQELLLELAEKYDKEGKSYFPIEVRLGFMVLLNAVIFFVLKWVLGDANSDLAKGIASAIGGTGEENGWAGMVSSFIDTLSGGAPKATQSTLDPPKPRRRRREPSSTST